MTASTSTARASKRLGELLLERKLITKALLDEALQQQQAGGKKSLGEILVGLGFPQEKMTYALLLFNKRKPLGQILVDLGALLPAALEQALHQQRELKLQGVRRPIGMLLVESGAISQQTYLKALSTHFVMPVTTLWEFTPTHELQQAVGERFAEKHGIVVLDDGPAALQAAMCQPSAQALEELRRFVPATKRVAFYLASPPEVDRCFEKLRDPYWTARLKGISC